MNCFNHDLFEALFRPLKVCRRAMSKRKRPQAAA